MSTTVTYPIPGYPTVYLTTDGAQMTIRPMVPEDKDALLHFFQSIPAEDRFYLKDDVADPQVLERWAQTLNYNRALPLLAFLDGKIVGDGTLHPQRPGARKHIGEVRVVVAAAYRNRGVGRALLHKLIELAGDQGLKKLRFEVVADTERAARHTAQVLGFAPVATLPGQVRDAQDTLHDVVILERQLDPELFVDGEVEGALPFF